MRCICAKKDRDIPLGRTGENDVEAVSFDVKDWPDLYGTGGSFVLVHKRPGDTQPYLCATAVASSGRLVWVIKDEDLQFTGRGEAQLSYVVDSKVAKSVIFTTRISRSLEQEGELPEPYESMIEELIAAAANITTEADRAETARDAAETAQGKAEDAERDAYLSAEQAEGSAVRAEAAKDAVENLTVTVETLPPGSSATAEKTVDPQTGRANIAFGLPKGEKGDQGDDYVLTNQDREDIAELVEDDTDIFQEHTGRSIEEILVDIRAAVQVISNFVEYTGDTELSDYSTMWVQNKVLKAAIDAINTALSGKQATLTFDDAPTQNSNNPVKSGGVYSAVKALTDAILAGTEETAAYHLGFYLDENGDLVQVDDE